MVQCLRSREAWIRVVVRNSQDFVLASMKEKILLPHLVANVESMAAVRAFMFCSRSTLVFRPLFLRVTPKLLLKLLVIKMNHSPPMVTSSLRQNYLHMPFVLLVFLILVNKVIM